jgi:hypothetical protein
MIDWFFFLCRRHNDYLFERKFKSNAILWKIINEKIRNENAKKMKVILENKNYSRSNQSKNLTWSRFIHFKNDDKISFEKDEMLEDFVCKFVSNQWKFRKFRSIELATSLCLSTKNEIVEFCSSHFQIRHFLCYCKLVQFLKNSNSNHVMIANKVIVYLNDIKNFVIEFSEKFSEVFLCANDAAFADDELIKKSSNDYLFKLYDDSIDWRAIKQITMTTSDIETKLLILSRIAKKIIWWKRFFESI